jgi:hypothetical protein
VKPAATPFTFIALTSVNPEPAIVTSAPAAAFAGKNEVSFGSTLNVATLSPVPPGFVTPICPVRPPAGTAAFTCVADTEVGAAATPPKLTAVAEAMFVPFTVTTVPTAPEAGVKLDTVGAGTVTVKSDALVAVPPAVVTAIGPVVAPAGTVAVTCVAESTENVVALVPWKVTASAPVRSVPVIVTLVPTGPLGGVNPLIVGTGGGVPHDGNLKCPIRVCHPRSLVVGKYSFAYQKVQSSEGSTFIVL